MPDTGGERLRIQLKLPPFEPLHLQMPAVLSIAALRNCSTTPGLRSSAGRLSSDFSLEAVGPVVALVVAALAQGARTVRR
ncbi:hypothetical protein ACXX9E_29580 [Pseudomonas sp. GNP014]